ncbi:Hypothetical_protein [Hexamita inflata]|uniref:Hypothetical_protein n=1 Tax=Hexamita inflata TaxID=28002 RepID=A0AA86NP64_9EUKA|nr:Hypothetical protein HINF_LOCUS10843 [Hexamita inflata]CAI9923199.1 Hypothetical protein HINF_LOCUS10844 [Hexamita inflata]
MSIIYFNYLSDCQNACSNGYCNDSYSYQHEKNMYSCVKNPAGIYNSQSSCNDNCYYGYCDANYSSSHNRYEYYCVQYTSNNGCWFLLLLLIPVLAGLLTTIICCNKKRITAKSIQKQALKQERDELIVQAVTEVTLPNSQTGLFVPLTQTQQDKLHSNNQVKIYQPQSIYQPQPVQMMDKSAPQFQTVQNPQIQPIQVMPVIPI